MDPIEAAIEAINSRGLGENLSYNKIAKEFGVVRSTLIRRHKARCQQSEATHDNRQNLSQQQETELPRYTTRLDRQSRESSTSKLSASDWRKIERLIKAAVDVGAGDKIKKLSRTIHSISVQNQLLERENEGLRKTLVILEKRQTRDRPLPLEPPDGYRGGAIFWSPRSIQRARDRLHQQDIEEQQLQLRKSEQAEARRASQELKKRLLQEKRVAHAAARDAREKQRVDKAAKRHLDQQARKARKQLQDRIKIAKRGTKKTSQPTTRSIKTKKPQREPADPDEASSVASTSQSRSGRIIRTPSRYR